MRKVLEHRALVACAERSDTFGVILIGTDEKIPGTSNLIVWVAHSAIQAAIKVEHQEIKNVCAVKLPAVPTLHDTEPLSSRSKRLCPQGCLLVLCMRTASSTVTRSF